MIKEIENWELPNSLEELKMDYNFIIHVENW